jgi:hypothetical protein
MAETQENWELRALQAEAELAETRSELHSCSVLLHGLQESAVNQSESEPLYAIEEVLEMLGRAMIAEETDGQRTSMSCYETAEGRVWWMLRVGSQPALMNDSSTIAAFIRQHGAEGGEE